MNLKRNCSYRNCKEKSPSSYTFFAFPKDRNRHQKWVEMSQCLDTASKHPRFLCERHFSKNYMSITPRRKTLLNTAVPKNFFDKSIVQTEIATNSEINTDEIDKTTIHFGIHSEDGIDSHFNDFMVTETENEHNTEIRNSKGITSNSIAVKEVESIQENNFEEDVVYLDWDEKYNEQIEASSTEQQNDDKSMEKNGFTTFTNEEGVEFIQMSKAEYIKERQALHHYRSILQRLKRELKDIT